MRLELKKISKIYRMGTTEVPALKEISIGFRSHEFVSILGPSGCGKTTLLNIIGGLDRYDSGTLYMDGQSTKEFTAKDWDAYRNHAIGFVFQSYNLIAHQTVLQNVELPMALSGIPGKVRREKAVNALKDVGLEEQMHKHPNQLSGGQMQRVAIARAIVNDPAVILADEPTGALDSKTSEQIMDILQKLSKKCTVIMVTHNKELAEEYSNRIIHLFDGNVISDTHPLHQKNAKHSTIKAQIKQTAMSMFTACKLSFMNLISKKKRTLITAFAGSIGIVGTGLALSLSYGVGQYIENLQSETLAGYPITVHQSQQNVDFLFQNAMKATSQTKDNTAFTNKEIIYRYDRSKDASDHRNVITEDYLTYIEKIHNKLPDSVSMISYDRELGINLLAKGEDKIVKFATDIVTAIKDYEGKKYWKELPTDYDLVRSTYDLIGENSRMPKNKNEIVLVVDEYNRLDEAFFEKLGFEKSEDQKEYDFTSFIGQEILKIIPNNQFYSEISEGHFTPADPSKYEELFTEETAIPLKIVGILRVKEDAPAEYLSQGIAFTPELMQTLLDDAAQSDIAKAQADLDYDVVFNNSFKNETERKESQVRYGANSLPNMINIYPKDFNNKELVKEYLDQYNKDLPQDEQIISNDLAGSITSIIGNFVNIVSLVLIGFAAISMLISSIMIGIITYTSVIERTKEIGILRSVGARSKDIRRMFVTESMLIGLTAGTIGTAVAYGGTVIVSRIIYDYANVDHIARLRVEDAALLIIGNAVLVTIAGLIPASIASKKDPVKALRTD